MEHLLTISGDEFDGGTWWRWLTSEERGVWSGATDVRLAVQGGAFPFPQDGVSLSSSAGDTRSTPPSASSNAANYPQRLLLADRFGVPLGGLADAT